LSAEVDILLLVMIKPRSAQEPVEIVILTASTLLGALCGAAAAFLLWSQTRHVADPGMLTAAALALATGVGLVSLTVERRSVQLCLAAAAVTLAIAFFSGGAVFATLTP
jgi:uncharacterized membrane protein YgdD (TMEM256/DUF423 family)